MGIGMIKIESCIRCPSKNCVKATHAVILLPGRGHSAEMMLNIFDDLLQLENLVIYSLHPEKEWYPLPNGINDQIEAVEGLKSNTNSIRDYVFELLKQENISIENTIMIGFSAGAVVALEILTSFQDKFSMIIGHSGAILVPDEIKMSENSTKIVLFHRQDDYCFDWNERYIPMKNALIEKNYNLELHEMLCGSHLIYREDLNVIKELVKSASSNIDNHL